MKMGIEGKRALITGSNTGIGKGIARMLAAEGVHVIVHGRERTRAERTARDIIGDGGHAEYVVGDLSTAEGAVSAIEAALSTGSIDILVNNVGGSDTALSDWLSISEEQWQHSFSLNVLSAVRTIRALVPEMCKRGWGRVINVGSAGATTSSADIADYQASKAALLSLTFSLAQALGGTGVTANMISPGPILTPGPRRWLHSVAQERGVDFDIVATEMARDHYGMSVHRWGSTEEIGAAVTMLASTWSNFTTGTNLHVDGGQTHGLH